MLAEQILKSSNEIKVLIEGFFTEKHKVYIYVDTIKDGYIFFNVTMGGTEQLKVMVSRFGDNLQVFEDCNWVTLTNGVVYKWYLTQMLNHTINAYDEDALRTLDGDKIYQMECDISEMFKKQLRDG